MYQIILIILISLSLISCQTQQEVKPIKTVENKINVSPKPTITKKKEEKTEILETFSDESKIGMRRKSKIELIHSGNSEKNFVGIKFFSRKKGNNWKLQQTFEIEKYGSLPLQPELKDFNNDGFKDITFVSGIAARGANEIRDLFIYNKSINGLIHIKNSSDYPNLKYNSELDCLDSWIFTGSTSTVFLKIKGDELEEFASVSNGLTRRIQIIDKNGKKKLLREEKIDPEEGFQRYKNFNPLKTYSHP